MAPGADRRGGGGVFFDRPASARLNFLGKNRSTFFYNFLPDYCASYVLFFYTSYLLSVPRCYFVLLKPKSRAFRDFACKLFRAELLPGIEGRAILKGIIEVFLSGSGGSGIMRSSRRYLLNG